MENQVGACQDMARMDIGSVSTNHRLLARRKHKMSCSERRSGWTEVWRISKPCGVIRNSPRSFKFGALKQEILAAETGSPHDMRTSTGIPSIGAIVSHIDG